MDLVLGWKEINGTPRFVLSRKGREELKEYPLTLTLSRKGRGKKEDGKILTAPLTLSLSRGVERGLVKGEKG
jgi:hypothetical protein